MEMSSIFVLLLLAITTGLPTTANGASAPPGPPRLREAPIWSALSDSQAIATWNCSTLLVDPTTPITGYRFLLTPITFPSSQSIYDNVPLYFSVLTPIPECQFRFGALISGTTYVASLEVRTLEGGWSGMQNSINATVTIPYVAIPKLRTAPAYTVLSSTPMPTVRAAWNGSLVFLGQTETVRSYNFLFTPISSPYLSVAPTRLYRLRISDYLYPPGFPLEPFTIRDPVDCEYTFEGLLPGVTYNIAFQAYWRDWSGFQNSINATVTVPTLPASKDGVTLLRLAPTFAGLSTTSAVATWFSQDLLSDPAAEIDGYRFLFTPLDHPYFSVPPTREYSLKVSTLPGTVSDLTDPANCRYVFDGLLSGVQYKIAFEVSTVQYGWTRMANSINSTVLVPTSPARIPTWGVAEATSNSVTLRWNPDLTVADCGGNHCYYVSYTIFVKSNGQDVAKYPKLGYATSETVITNLQPNTAYSFTLSVDMPFFPSNVSLPLFVTTLDGPSQPTTSSSTGTGGASSSTGSSNPTSAGAAIVLDFLLTLDQSSLKYKEDASLIDWLRYELVNKFLLVRPERFTVFNLKIATYAADSTNSQNKASASTSTTNLAYPYDLSFSVAILPALDSQETNSTFIAEQISQTSADAIFVAPVKGTSIIVAQRRMEAWVCDSGRVAIDCAADALQGEGEGPNWGPRDLPASSSSSLSSVQLGLIIAGSILGLVVVIGAAVFFCRSSISKSNPIKRPKEESVNGELESTFGIESEITATPALTTDPPVVTIRLATTEAV